jgi:hypothetical protein
MSENGKFPQSTEIWTNASQARDIQLALMFELAATAFVESWEALRPHLSPAPQAGASDDKPAAASTPDKADAR